MLVALALVTLSLGVVSLLLFGMSWFEQRVLSPKALIVHAARARQAPPEHVEKLVARQSERLMESLSLTRPERSRTERRTTLTEARRAS